VQKYVILWVDLRSCLVGVLMIFMKLIVTFINGFSKGVPITDSGPLILEVDLGLFGAVATIQE